MQNKYSIISKLESKKSDLYRGVRLIDNKQVILKKVSYSQMPAKQKKQIVDQVNALGQMRSANIIKYYEHLINKAESQIVIVMQFCEGGSLEKALQDRRQKRKRLEQDVIWKFMAQVIQALDYIHSRKQAILHRNIKPSNIFLDSRGDIKLGDFGLARKLDPEEHFSSTLLTQTYYLSPEQLESGIFSKATDVWALGCLMYEMCMLQPPFIGKNEFQTEKLIREGKIKRVPYSNEMNRVIYWCLDKNPAQRPNTQDLRGIPQINIKIRHKRFEEHQKILNNRQIDLQRKEKELRDLEIRLMEERRMKIKQESTIYQSIKKSVQNSSKVFSPLDCCYPTRNLYN